MVFWQAMTIVLQLTRQLYQRPETPAVDGVRLRHYAGPADVETWLALRRQAFARQRVSLGDWDAADFAREFLEKPWWRPECMWFAEARGALSLGPRTVGTVTLARRGDPPRDRPVVHWLAVLPGYRRRGVGRLLMAALEAAVWDAGERQVWLETHSAWAEASRLYGALGYTPVVSAS
ncbi:MAG: GNAT family N-acetyltransferase [Pirellulales bacterium]